FFFQCLEILFQAQFNDELPVMSAKSRLLVSFSVVGMVSIAVALALVFAKSPGDISAQGILEDAQETNATVETYKSTVSAWQTPQVEGDPAPYETSITVTVVFNQGMHIVMTGNGEYSESLLLDGKEYERDSADGEWEEQPSSFDSSRMLTLDSSKHFHIVNDLLDSTVVGKETLRGVKVNKIIGMYDLAQRVQAIWGDPEEQDPDLQERLQMLAGTEEFTGWVGIEDGLIHAYEVSGSYPAEEELLAFQFWYRVDFSHFNQPLTLPSVE
ncbi:MAG: hypothetical protein J4F46_01430, partial [Dehalococcoidia bacterium]|nr:hypothetical protein [Dehalococcoidia bacterium]